MTTEYNEFDDSFNYIQASIEFERFEKTHIVLWANILEIVHKHKLNNQQIKEFCDLNELHERGLRTYLYRAYKGY